MIEFIWLMVQFSWAVVKIIIMLAVTWYAFWYAMAFLMPMLAWIAIGFMGIINLFRRA